MKKAEVGQRFTSTTWVYGVKEPCKDISFFLCSPPLKSPTNLPLLSSLLLSFSARILFTSVLLITGRASLDLTDVAIIQGISGLNTRAYLGSFPDGLAAKAPSAPLNLTFFLFRSALLRSCSPASLWFVIFYKRLACWCCFIQIGALGSHFLQLHHCLGLMQLQS